MAETWRRAKKGESEGGSYSPGGGLYVDFRPGGPPSAEHEGGPIGGTGAPSKGADPAGRGGARSAPCGWVHGQPGGSALESSSACRQRPPVGAGGGTRWRHHLKQ